ncbi:MAG: ribonuclease HII [Proteobacteria bacterium]|nr:ribonuclease HII [Desulfobulbaceae bacterium]MBU4151401.1 ribonuclease HII [Pseudomonadota bacterium]MDP2107275.1 ribonuclease HII [Desulfobulbaceae bacterium]
MTKDKPIRHDPQASLFSVQECDSFSFERELYRQGFRAIAGTDEVGRGPLAGPVVAACVILPRECDFSQFKDSKKLTPAIRQQLTLHLRDIGAVIGVGVISERIIDRYNILQASLLAMKKAMEDMPQVPDFLLVDGKFPVPVSVPQRALVKGDSRSATIAAASIVAKVTRDELMKHYHNQYPHYSFQSNMGYPTAEHRRALAEHGPCPLHRKSFAGVKEFFAGGHDQG